MTGRLDGGRRRWPAAARRCGCRRRGRREQRPTTGSRSSTGSATIEREYRDCHDIAETATAEDADIDQDIAATRGADMQRSMVVQTRTAQMPDKTRRSADSIIASCMQQRGFAERR